MTFTRTKIQTDKNHSEGSSKKSSFKRTSPVKDPLMNDPGETNPVMLPKSKKEIMELLAQNPFLVLREIHNRSFLEFFKTFWPEVSSQELKMNWHIEYLCNELQKIAEQVGENKPKLHDLIINISPGSTKTIITSIMFPAWCWTRWYWMRFITLSYSATLSLESAEFSRDLIKSERFQAIYPELEIKQDKDTKGNFRVVKKVDMPGRVARQLFGGNRYSTSVGGTLTGFHGHIIIVDDPLNPQQAVSEVELKNTNRWLDQTLPTRKVDKSVTPSIYIMQRLHENDPSGHILDKHKKSVKHICLPGEIRNYKDKLKPSYLASNYIDDLMDIQRLGWEALAELEADLGQYGYAGQIGQSPTPPAGGMFKVDRFVGIEYPPPLEDIKKIVRYWDKAGTKVEAGSKTKAAYTVGVKMAELIDGHYVILDVVRGRWSSEEREMIIKSTAQSDGKHVTIYMEQEPGSGGKESAEASIRNLAGYTAFADHPTGDKVYRADPYSVQVNNGNVMLLKGDWNHDFIEEHRHFPFSTYKDQVDAASGAFAQRKEKKRVKVHA